MDFETPERIQPVLLRIREFLQGEVYAIESEVATKGFRATEPKLRALREKVKQLGLWAPQAPREYGGMGLSLLEHGLVSETFGRSVLGHYLFGCQAPDAGNIEVLHLHGTEEQKRRWLVPLIAGDLRSCFAMTEPDNPGSNPTQLSTRATRDGDQYVLDGHKWFTTGADGAAFAIVMAVTEPAAAPHLRASMILVPTDTPGFRIVRNISVMGHEGSGWMSHAEVRLEGCRVPVSNRLGAEGGGFLIAQERLGPGRIHHAMRWMGICERAFDLMCERAQARRMDPDSVLGDKQLVQAWIAESRAKIDAARLLILRAAWKIDRGGFSEAQEEISMIKFHASEVLKSVVDRAIQVHGALGLTDDTPLASWYAQERAAEIYDGPNEVHKLAAARRILRRYGAGK